MSVIKTATVIWDIRQKMIPEKTQKTIILPSPKLHDLFEPQELEPGISAVNGRSKGLAQRVLLGEFASLVLNWETGHQPPRVSFVSPLWEWQSSPLMTSRQGNREAYTYQHISILDNLLLFGYTHCIQPSRNWPHWALSLASQTISKTQMFLSIWCYMWWRNRFEAANSLHFTQNLSTLTRSEFPCQVQL